MITRTYESGDVHSLTYNANNKLESADINGSTLLSNTYDGDGTLVQKTGLSGTTTYVGGLYEIYPTSGGSHAIRKTYTFGGQRVAISNDGVLSYLHSDHLNSASLATDASGNKVAGSDTRYTPFGQTRDGYEGTDLPTDRRYTGQREVADLGLYDYNSRYYDPYIGRFIQADTIIPDPGSAQGYNRYSYVDNNPLRYNDPTGHYYCGDHYDPACLETEEEKIAFGRMSRAGAAYALKWHDRINPEYPEMSNVKDCTSFGSQTLSEVGLQPTERWHFDGENSPSAWSYTRTDPSNVGQEGDYGRTLDGLYNYLTDDAGYGFAYTDYANVSKDQPNYFSSDDLTRPNDIVVYYQNTNEGEMWTHVAVVVGWGPQNGAGIDILNVNEADFLSYNKGGDLTIWVAEHSGVRETIRPIQNTGSAVIKMTIVHVGLFQ